ncbi:MAG: AMIN domain-containing protein, partial [Cyanobacteria bacterium P01_H01_bin.105]
MKQGSGRLALMALLSGGLVGIVALPGWAQESSRAEGWLGHGGDESSLRIQSPISDSMRLTQTPLVQITNVRLEETEMGLQVILQVADGELSAPTTATSRDALIVDIPNAVLVGEGFEQFNPAEGIALVQVSALADDQVQVAITGADAAPEVVIDSDAAGLTLSVVPGIAQAGEDEETIRILVTGEQDEGYAPSRASTATRTDTP